MAQSLEDIIRHLADGHQKLSHTALRELARLGRPELRMFAAAWPSIAVGRRRTIAHEMVEMSEDDAELDFGEVLRILLSDGDPDVRATAISGLWEDHDERLVDTFIAILANDPNLRVRAAAAEALGSFTLLAVLGRLHGDRPQRLRAALLAVVNAPADEADEAMELRRRALESVAYLEGEDVAQAIASAYTADEHDMKVSAVFSMGRNCDPRWIPYVEKELHSPSPELRFEAARAAGELEMTMAVPRLIEMITDPDRQVQMMSVWALGQIGGALAKKTLQNLTNSNDDELREVAEEALAELEFNEQPLIPSEIKTVKPYVPPRP
jgi:HEAT repeat protein